MLLRAGVLSFLLLLASRLSGLARDSAQAAAFGTSGLADVAVLLFTLPDWVAAVAASGALGYVLLPLWARQTPGAQAHSQKTVARVLLALGLLVGLCLCLWPLPAGDLLAPGLAGELRAQLGWAIPMAAIAVPMALVASVWATRLQHHRDFTGLYGANLVVNAGLIVTIIFIANYVMDVGQSAILALGVVCSGVLRLVWQGWRLRRVAAHSVVGSIPGSSAAAALASEATRVEDAQPRTAIQVWLWALLAAGGPTALMLVARSGASTSAEGGLASFNYAWKLVELPSVLVLQLLATLVLPVLSQAIARGDEANAAQAAQRARALAWTFGCACAAGLPWGAWGAAEMLFGWGRMGQGDVQTVALWATSAAWVLVPQAVLGISGAALAARGQLKWLGLAYACAAMALLAAAQGLTLSPVRWMQALVGVTVAVALAALWAELAASASVGSRARSEPMGARRTATSPLDTSAKPSAKPRANPGAFLTRGALLAAPYAAPLAVALALSTLARWQNPWVLAAPLAALWVGVLAAGLVLVASLASNPTLRAVFAGFRRGRKG